MFGANAYANQDDFLAYPGKAPRALPDAHLYGLSATYRLYPCADGQWLFLALCTSGQRRRFMDVLEAAGVSAPAFEVLDADGAAAAEALSVLFSKRDADQWQSLLAGAGVGCVRADRFMPSEFWLEDPQAQALGLSAEVTHPAWGAYRRHGSMVSFDRQAPPLGAPPLAGQHNEDVLKAQGRSPEDIARWYREGVIYREG